MSWLSSCIYLVDHCLGTRKLPELLRDAGVQVKLHKDVALPNAPDEDWIPEAAARGWVILTQDAQMSRNPFEMEVLSEHKARYVSLGSAQLTADEQASILLAHIQRLDSLLAAVIPPVFCRVTKTQVSLLLHGKWQRMTRKHQNPQFWRKRTW